MRGADITQESLFSTVHLNSFVPADHPLREVRVLLDEALGRLNGLFKPGLCSLWQGIDCPGETVTDLDVAGVLLHPQRACADGASAVQLVVSLVHRPEY